MKSDVLSPGSSRSTGASGVEQEATKQVVPYAFSNHASVPQIGYKLPFFIDSRPFLTHEGQHSQEMRHLNGEGVDLASIGIGHPTSSEAPSSTFCRTCPQYGHALIFPRKCYYEAQCPLPLLFCAEIQHGEKAVRSSNTEPRVSHQTLVHSFLRRLSSTLSKKIAYNDPTRENTNFGWRKKA